MFSYLKRNLRLLNDRMATNLPQVGYIAPQGTYIAWLDFSPLGLDDPAAYFRERTSR